MSGNQPHADTRSAGESTLSEPATPLRAQPLRTTSSGLRPLHGATARVPSIRVLCVDDHEVLVEGLKAQFSLDPSIEVVGWLDSAQNLLEVVRRTQPHVVLLDIEMPGPDAFEMADRIHQTMPHVQVIVLTAHIREAFLAAAYKCGASGYFSKADHLAELVDAVRQCASRRSGERAEILLGSKVRERCLRQDHLAIRSTSSSVS